MKTTTIKNAIDVEGIISFWKCFYITIILTALGLVALTTAILIAYPVIAYFATMFI